MCSRRLICVNWKNVFPILSKNKTLNSICICGKWDLMCVSFDTQIQMEYQYSGNTETFVMTIKKVYEKIRHCSGFFSRKYNLFWRLKGMMWKKMERQLSSHVSQLQE